MGFVDAIKTCFYKYAYFAGRASKAEYWWFFLFLVVGSLVLSSINKVFNDVFAVATLVPSLAVGSRRLHDTDRSGWWQLLWAIPLLGWIAIIYFLIQDPKEPNRFTENVADSTNTLIEK